MKKEVIKQSENQIQHSCLEWFRVKFPQLRLLLFAVPNGGLRDSRGASVMKYTGVISGVADLILLVPKKGYASLCIEMKTPKGKQSDNQKEWQTNAEKFGNKYVVCHSLDEFIKEVSEYLL